jgi:cell division septum initiation protein DivIVA
MARYSTEEDRRVYGDELLDVVARKAYDTLAPTVERLQGENQNLQQRVRRSEANNIFHALDAALRNWREINVDPSFLRWLGEATCGIVDRASLRCRIRASPNRASAGCRARACCLGRLQSLVTCCVRRQVHPA